MRVVFSSEKAQARIAEPSKPQCLSKILLFVTRVISALILIVLILCFLLLLCILCHFNLLERSVGIAAELFRHQAVHAIDERGRISNLVARLDECSLENNLR